MSEGEETRSGAVAPVRTELLFAGLRLVQRRGLAEPLAGVGMSEIAGRSGLSSASALRAVGSRARLDRMVAEVAAYRSTPMRQGMAVWVQSRGAGQVSESGAADEGVAATLQMWADQDREFPLFALWSLADRPEVTRLLGHAQELAWELYAVSTAAQLGQVGLRPTPDLGLMGYVMVAGGFMVGSTVVGAIDGDVDAERIARGMEAFVSLAVVDGAVEEPLAGPLADIVPAPPAIEPGAGPVIDGALAVLRENGVAGPFDHLTVRSVCREANVSPAAMYSHWDSIARYRSDLADFVLVSASRRLAADLSPEPRVGVALRHWLRGVTGVPLLLRLTILSDEARQRVRAHIDAAEASLASVVPEASGRPSIRDALSLAIGCEIYRAQLLEVPGAPPDRRAPEDVLVTALGLLDWPV